MNEKVYFFEVAYKGTNYRGWQKQPNAPSVQQKIEEVFSTMLKKEIDILGSGRTDAGVHASSQIFQLKVDGAIDIENVLYRANKMLPHDIALKNVREVNSEAHARFDATSRSYEYKISTKKNPFGPDLVYHFNHSLDFEIMNEAAALLLKYEDFESFSKVKTDVYTFNCHIFEAEWRKDNSEANEEWIFHVTANRFLRGMVRALVGTLLDVGTGKMSVEDFRHVIEAKNRTAAGRAVPAHGLFLSSVKYPETIYKK